MAKKKTNGQIEEKVEYFTRQLRVELTPKEIAERADRAAHVIMARDAKEDDRKAANTAAKSQIEELEAEHRRLSSEVRDKATYTLVECERRYDYRTGTVREVRKDTAVVLDSRAMRDDERQTSLDLPDPPGSNGTAAVAKKLGDAVEGNEPPLPTQKPAKGAKAKAKGNGRGKGRSTEARA